MDDKQFREIANNYIEKLHTHSYELLVGKKGKTRNIIINFDIDEYTHISGLDHLDDIKNYLDNLRKNRQSQPKHKKNTSTIKFSDKEKLFNNILNGKFKYSQMHSSFVALCTPLDGTYNTQSKTGYSIQDRLVLTKSLDTFLENLSFKCSFYKWDKKLSHVPLPNELQKGKYKKFRNISICADYVLKIPSYSLTQNKDENIYLFLAKSSALQLPKKINEPIKLNVISAFSDCVDLTYGQEKPFSILKVDKCKRMDINLNKYNLSKSFIANLASEPDRTNIYIGKNLSLPSNESKQIQTYQPPLSIGTGGAAVIDTSYPLTAFGSRPPSLHEIIEKVKSFIKNLVSVSPNTNVHKKTTTPKKKKAKTSAAQQRKKSVKSKTQKSSVQGKKRTSSAQQPKRTQSKPKSVPQQQEKRTAERKEPVYPLSRKKIKEAAAIIKANEQNRAKSQNRSKSRSDNTLE